MSHLKCNTRSTRMKKYHYPLTQRGLFNQIVLFVYFMQLSLYSQMCKKTTAKPGNEHCGAIIEKLVKDILKIGKDLEHTHNQFIDHLYNFMR